MRQNCDSRIPNHEIFVDLDVKIFEEVKQMYAKIVLQCYAELTN